MPEARRREIRRWSERRGHRRRRVRVAGTSALLVVTTAVLLSAAPGAHAPTGVVTLELTSGELVGRPPGVASRGGERTPDAEPAGPSPATSSVSPTAAPPEAPTAAPEPATTRPSPTTASPEPAVPLPAPQAAAVPDGAPPDVGAAMSAEIITLSNAERAAVGLPALGASGCATEQAAARAALLVAEGRFEHDPLGPIIDACAARTVGENLSVGYRTAQAAVAGWMGSPGHRENLLRPAFTQLGVACVQGPRGWLCAQVFLG